MWFRFALAVLLSWGAGLPGSAEDRFPVPPDAGVVNVRDYGAVPNDGQDDTDAIRKAIRYIAQKSSRYGHPLMLFFPRGTYDVSDSIEFRAEPGSWGDGWLSGGHFIGESRTGTVIRLKDNCPGFGADAPKARPVFKTGSEEQAGLEGKPNPEGWGNEAFRHYFRNLTVDTGKGNPNAIGIDYLCSNRGAVKDVTIRSGDGQGAIGLAMDRAWAGPALVKNVSIEGFDVGISMINRHYQYGMTLENITLRNQNRVGFRVDNNVAAIRRLTSTNRVPVVQVNGEYALVLLLESQFRGGNAEAAAITSQGNLLVRNLRSEGYSTIIDNRRKGNEGTVRGGRGATRVAEYVSSAPQTLFPVAKPGTLNLPIEETPEYTNGNFADWANVTAYGATPNNDSDDDAPAIQKAIDSGKPVVYLPNGAYHLRQPLIIRGNVRKIIGFQSSLGKKGEFDPLIRFTRTGPNPTILEHLWMAEGMIEHASSGTLSLQHCDHGGYRTTEGNTGKTFIEDVIGSNYRINGPHRFWGRQVNSEFRPNPLLVNNGGTMWILNLKTEGAVTVLRSVNGRTELLGGLVYPLSHVKGRDIPAFDIEGGSVSLSYVLNGQSYEHHVREVNGETRYSPNYGRSPLLYVSGSGSVAAQKEN
ncbi:MAG: hypothetical protein OHK0029_16270 [Armatimonadaceae bacterium]